MEEDLNDGATLEGRSEPCSKMLASCKGSHSIAKQAPAAKSRPSSPTVRIIHVFAPEIIKTDPSNFRELVQKLTGKPIGRGPWTRHRASICKQQIPPRSEPAAAEAAATRAVSPVAPDLKQEEEASSRNSTGNPTFCFNGLGDLDGILAGILQTASSDTSQSTPLLQVDTSNHQAF